VSESNDLIEMTTEIVSAFVSNSTISPADLPALIHQVHSTLNSIATGAEAEPATQAQQPAIPVKKSITPDYLICLEDGRKFKSLKRHLRTKYDMTPDDYRAKWGLPKDYPMVAPNYAAARSNLAKQSGLGQGGRKPAARAAKPRAAK
jgi:predicted transcriptional regulator